MNHVIYELTEHGPISFDVYSRLAKDRILFLLGDINGKMAGNFCASLLYLDMIAKEEITIFINSGGGTINSGLFPIYDTMKIVNSPIRTICLGEACSSAAVVLSAGTKGKRFAYPNSLIMIHNVQAFDISGDKSEIDQESKRICSLNKKFTEIIAKNCGKKRSVVEKDCDSEKYFTASEAVKYGLIDKVVKYTK